MIRELFKKSKRTLTTAVHRFPRTTVRRARGSNNTSRGRKGFEWSDRKCRAVKLIKRSRQSKTKQINGRLSKFHGGIERSFGRETRYQRASERDKQVAALVNKVARAFVSNTFLPNVRESLAHGEKKRKVSFPLDYHLP